MLRIGTILTCLVIASALVPAASAHHDRDWRVACLLGASESGHALVVTMVIEWDDARHAYAGDLWTTHRDLVSDTWVDQRFTVIAQEFLPAGASDALRSLVVSSDPNDEDAPRLSLQGPYPRDASHAITMHGVIEGHGRVVLTGTFGVH